MSFFSQFDPTSGSSAFGGIVRQGIAAVPGGSTALGVVDAYNGKPTNRAAPTDRSGVTASGAAISSTPWYARTATVVGAGVAVGLLVVALVFLRRK